ncbi:hypothetical protein [Xanthomonas cannabis]|uniref:hypothetical protein n=1 Tax=Xanthomonas cannabis TaxID=1885674 RepID=UPI00141A9B6C|nr:hypothetical protein [Xanthomonas cannabis]NIK16989.1 hypothetical protein [Xanthomonas cannabis]
MFDARICGAAAFGSSRNAPWVSGEALRVLIRFTPCRRFAACGDHMCGAEMACLSIAAADSAGTQPSRTVRTVEVSFKQVASMDYDSSQQLRILRDIHDTKPVSDEEGNWAVRAGYATQAEDGDIDLTHEGRKALDDGQA